MPSYENRIKRYEDPVPLLGLATRSRRRSRPPSSAKCVTPSGGAIAIDPTEALVSIDINSARATGARGH